MQVGRRSRDLNRCTDLSHTIGELNRSHGVREVGLDTGGQAVSEKHRQTIRNHRIGSRGIACLAGWSILAACSVLWHSHSSTAQAETAATQPKQAPDETAVDPPRPPSPAEVLQQLMKQDRHRPAVIPPGSRAVIKRKGPGRATTQLAVSPTQEDSPLRPDGTMIADRVGRLVRRPEGWFLVFESDQQVLREPPMQLLPNRDLETMEILSANATRAVKFRVSGEVTEYRGRNYLLLRKVLTVHNLGNLK